MRTAVLAIVVLLGGSAHAASLESKCLTKSEARKAFPRSHLYWGNVDGRRCWSDRRGGRTRMGVDGLRPHRGTLPPSLRPNPEPPPSIMVPEADPELPPPFIPPDVVPSMPERPPAFPLPFNSRWIEQGENHTFTPSGKEDGGVIFSTFQGAPPDVWPALRHQPSVMTLFAMLLSAAVAFVAGARSITAEILRE